VALLLVSPLALAQITVGTVTGRVVDTSGAVVAGARVDLIGETQGTKTAAVITNAAGDYVIPNLAPDTYTLEHTGNFSQSLNNQGVALNPIINYQSGAPFPGNIIPANQLYAPGQAVLNQYPLPNLTQGPGQNYNWQINAPAYQQLTRQPAGKLDYRATQKLRFSVKYSGQIARDVTTPGYILGFNDAYVPYPYITNLGGTVTYVISPTTFLDGTYGRIENQLAGGNESGIPTDASSNRLTALPTFPELYPDAGEMNTGYYGYQVMQATKAPCNFAGVNRHSLWTT
jgi:hypothetical protein